MWALDRAVSYILLSATACPGLRMITLWHHGLQVYEVNKKLLQEHAAPLMAVYLHGVAVVREELNMDVSKKPVKGRLPAHGVLQLLHLSIRTSHLQVHV